MHIGIDDAVSMYARACRAWYGPRAAKVARAEIQKLRKRGDWSGVEVWTKLAQQLEQPSAADLTLLPDLPPARSRVSNQKRH
jgi:hypothetical protein